MSSTAAVRTKLLGFASVSAKVQTRIYPKFRPQGTALPAIVLHTVNGAFDQSFAGPMGTQGNQFQADCMASTKQEADELRMAVMAALVAPGTAGATKFQGGFIEMYRDDFEDTTTGRVHTEQVRATLWSN